jgi:hypothetical protein
MTNELAIIPAEPIMYLRMLKTSTAYPSESTEDTDGSDMNPSIAAAEDDSFPKPVALATTSTDLFVLHIVATALCETKMAGTA